MRSGIVQHWRCSKCGGPIMADGGDYRCMWCGSEYTERDGLMSVMQAEPGVVWRMDGKHKRREEV